MKNIATNIYDWRPTTPFYYGWLILGTAAIGALIAGSVAQTVFGGIQDLIGQETGWNRKTVALAATLGTWTSGLTMPFIGRLVDRFGPRWIMLIAANMVGIGYIYLSNSNTLFEFFFAYIVIRAVAGPNLQNVVPRAVAVNFFSRRRNFAIGITTLNRVISESINIQAITLLATSYSWRIAYRILGIAAIPLSIPIFLLIRHKPEDIGLLPDGKKQSSSTDSKAIPQTASLSVKKIISLESFWLILIGEFVAVTATSMIIFQIVPYLVDAGMTQTVAAVALTIGNALGGLSVPGWGYLTDRYTTKRLAVVILTSAITMTLLLLLSPEGNIQFIVVIAWGIVTAVIFVLGTMMLGTVFERTSFGTVVGITGPSRTAAMGLGPYVGALAASWYGDYTLIFIAATIGYSLAIALYSSVQPRNTL